MRSGDLGFAMGLVVVVVVVVRWLSPPLAGGPTSRVWALLSGHQPGPLQCLFQCIAGVAVAIPPDHNFSLLLS